MIILNIVNNFLLNLLIHITGENNKFQVKYSDPKVCKSFLMACCPHEILSSTVSIFLLIINNLEIYKQDKKYWQKKIQVRFILFFIQVNKKFHKKWIFILFKLTQTLNNNKFILLTLFVDITVHVKYILKKKKM